jgi:DNA-binding CsgD family transcriptional regulator
MIQLSSENFSNLIAISRVSAESNSMDDLRKRIVRLVHKAFQSTSTIFWLTNDNNEMIDPVTQDIQEQYLLPYKSYFYRQNPFDPFNFPASKTPSVLMESLMPISNFQKTEYFNDFIKPQKIHRQMAVYIRQGNRIKGILGMHRSFKKSFGNNHIFMGNMIAEQLTAAFEKVSLMDEVNRSRDFMTMINQNRFTGIIILDDHGNVIFSNTKADQICERLGQKYALETWINECNNHSIGHLFKEQVFTVNPGEAYLVKYQSIDEDLSCLKNQCYMVTLQDAPAFPQIKAQVLKTKFNMTKRESEIVSFIVKGYTNMDIADTLFISEGTVKNHLKNIFAKTCAKNRTSLVCKVLGLN